MSSFNRKGLYWWWVRFKHLIPFYISAVPWNSFWVHMSFLADLGSCVDTHRRRWRAVMRGRGGGASPVIMEKCNKQIDRIVTLIKWSHYLISLSHHFSLNFNKLLFFFWFCLIKKKVSDQSKSKHEIKNFCFSALRGKDPWGQTTPPPHLCVE